MIKKYKEYIISVLIALGIGGLSALLTSKNMNLFDRINKPPLSPPSILFPIVWTILYILMGISSAMIYKSKLKDSDKVSSALTVYGFNLFLNFFWSIIFFNMKSYLFAFIWLVILLITIVVMIYKFYKIKPIAGLLQIPYLAWVTFAGYLTLAIYILNR